MRKIFQSFLAMVFAAVLGICALQSFTATPAEDAVTNVRQTLNADGTWTTKVNGKLVSAETEDATTPIAGNRFSWANNPEKLLCIKDYTREITTWDPNRVAVEWSKSPEFHMWWDDMNGGGNNCISYDQYQTISMYSNTNGGTTACGEVDIDLAAGGYIVRATVWLARDANNASCRQTFTLRQNIVSALVGRVLGLNFHTSISDSVMNAYLTYKLKIPYARPADFNGLSVRY